jgi:hypothetical protein
MFNIGFVKRVLYLSTHVWIIIRQFPNTTVVTEFYSIWIHISILSYSTLIYVTHHSACWCLFYYN